MSQSSLYHEHGVSVYRYQSTFYQKGKTYVKIYFPRKEYRCPCCGSDNVWVKETVIREFRSVPVGSREFIIVAAIPKFYCHDCNAIRQAPIPFARPKKHYTKRFERYVLSLLKGCTVQFVAEFLGVSWATIRDIEKEYLGKHFANPSLKEVKYKDIKDTFQNSKQSDRQVLKKVRITTRLIDFAVPTGKGKLGRIFHSLGKNNQVSEFFGEIAAVAVARCLGFERENISMGYHGFDALMFEPLTDHYVILEAKGNTSNLRGNQMKDIWINDRLKRLSSNIDRFEQHKKEVKSNRRGMLAMVVKVYVKSKEFHIATKVQTYKGIKSWGKPFE